MERADRTLPLRGIGDAGLGDHACWAYSDESTLLDVLTGYARDGLERGEKVACYPARSRVGALRERLGASGDWARAAMRDGTLLIGSFDEAYMPGGTFEPARRVADYARMHRRTLAEGYTGLRVMGEPTELLAGPIMRHAWPAYEIQVDLLIARGSLTALCAFDAHAVHGDGLAVLRAIHPTTLGWSVPSPFGLHGGPSGELLLHGEVDFTWSDVVGRLAIDVAPAVAEPALDLEGLRFLDVAGLRAILKGVRAIGETRGRVEVRNAPPAVRRMWDLLDCSTYVGAELVFS